MMEKRKGMPQSGKMLTFGIIGALIILALIISTILSQYESLTNWLSNTFDTRPRATVELSDTIVSTLSARAQLIAAEQTIDDLPVRVNVRAGVLNINGYGATYEADFAIKAGYDFKRPAFVVKALSDNEFAITLPALELLACSMSPIATIDRSTSFTANWEAAQELAEYMLLNQAVSEAFNNLDLEQTAQANARETIRGLLKELEPDLQLTFVFTETDEPMVDDTCQRRDPFMWDYDAQTGEWRRQ